VTTDTPTMRDRFAGQLVIEELIHEQSTITTRSTLQRFFGVSPLGADSTAWYTGARGEIAVGLILKSLPQGWAVFHALPIGKKDRDVDHLVVGPGGVFTINTKHHSGKSIWVAPRTFMVSGQKQPYIPRSEDEARIVTKLLEKWFPPATPVRPIIALVDPKRITIKQAPELVKVIDAKQLVRWLRKHPSVLDPTEVARIVELLDRPDVWRDCEPATDGLMAQFDALHGEVRSARVIRGFWGIVGIAILIAAAYFLLPPIMTSILSLA
jgi:hypothetical protein